VFSRNGAPLYGPVFYRNGAARNGRSVFVKKLRFFAIFSKKKSGEKKNNNVHIAHRFYEEAASHCHCERLQPNARCGRPFSMKFRTHQIFRKRDFLKSFTGFSEQKISAFFYVRIGLFFGGPVPQLT